MTQKYHASGYSAVRAQTIFSESEQYLILLLDQKSMQYLYTYLIWSRIYFFVWIFCIWEYNKCGKFTKAKLCVLCLLYGLGFRYPAGEPKIFKKHSSAKSHLRVPCNNVYAAQIKNCIHWVNMMCNMLLLTFAELQNQVVAYLIPQHHTIVILTAHWL